MITYLFTSGKRLCRYLLLSLLTLLPMAGAWGQQLGSKGNPYVIDVSDISAENAKANKYTISSSGIECAKGTAGSPVYYKLTMSGTESDSDLARVVGENVVFLVDGTVRINGGILCDGTTRIEPVDEEAVLELNKSCVNGLFTVYRGANATICEGVEVLATAVPRGDASTGVVYLFAGSTLTNYGTLMAKAEDGLGYAVLRGSGTESVYFKNYGTFYGYGLVSTGSIAFESFAPDNSLLSFYLGDFIPANTTFHLMKDGQLYKEIVQPDGNSEGFFLTLPAGDYMLYRKSADSDETVPLQGNGKETFTAVANKFQQVSWVKEANSYPLDLSSLTEGDLRDGYGRVVGDNVILTKPGGRYSLSGDGSGKTLSIQTGDTPGNSVTLELPYVDGKDKTIRLKRITIPESTHLGTLKIKSDYSNSRYLILNPGDKGTGIEVDEAAYLGSLSMGEQARLVIYGIEKALPDGINLNEKKGVTLRMEDGFPEGKLYLCAKEKDKKETTMLDTEEASGCREIFIASPDIQGDSRCLLFASDKKEKLYGLPSSSLGNLSEAAYTDLFEVGERYQNLSSPLDLNGFTAGRLYLTCDNGAWRYGRTADTPDGSFCGRIKDTGPWTKDVPIAISLSLLSDGRLVFDGVQRLTSPDGVPLDVSRPVSSGEAVTLALVNDHLSSVEVKSNVETEPALRIGDGVTCVFDNTDNGIFRFWACDEAVSLSGRAAARGLRMFKFEESPKGLHISYEYNGQPYGDYFGDLSSPFKSLASNYPGPLTLWDDTQEGYDVIYRRQYRGTKTLPVAGSDRLAEFPVEPDNALAAYSLEKPFALWPTVDNLSLTFEEGAFEGLETIYGTHPLAGNKLSMNLTFLSDRDLTLEDFDGSLTLGKAADDTDAAPADVRLTLRGDNSLKAVTVNRGSDLELVHGQGAAATLSSLALSESSSFRTDEEIGLTEGGRISMSLALSRERWNTIGLPMDVSVPAADIASLRGGFTSSADQRWEDVAGGNGPLRLEADAAYIVAPGKGADGEPAYGIDLSSEAATVIPADRTLELPSGLADGEFRFVANPNFHPVQLSDIYTLSADGNRFELHEEEVTVEAGAAFMAANAVTRRSLRSFGIGEGGGSIVTGNQLVVPDGSFRVWGSRGEMHLSSSRPSDVKIMSLSGSVVRDFRLDGDRVEPLPSGIYLVVCEHITYKVIL